MGVTVGVVDVDGELETAVDSGAPGRAGLRIGRNSFAATEKRNSLAAATKHAAVSLNLSAFCGGVRREKPLSGPTPHYLPLHRDIRPCWNRGSRPYRHRVSVAQQMCSDVKTLRSSKQAWTHDPTVVVAQCLDHAPQLHVRAGVIYSACNGNIQAAHP